MDNDFSAWLAKGLELRGWSQGELARRLGVSRPFVSRIIAGDASASVNFCVKLADAFGESAELILKLAGILPTTPALTDSPTLQEIIELSRNLPAEDQADVLEYVRFRFQRRKG